MATTSAMVDAAIDPALAGHTEASNNPVLWGQEFCTAGLSRFINIVNGFRTLDLSDRKVLDTVWFSWVEARRLGRAASSRAHIESVHRVHA